MAWIFLILKNLSVCSLNSIEDMANVGLYLNDLNRFDGSGEMLVIEEQHNQQLQKAFVAVNNLNLNHVLNPTLIDLILKQQAWTEKLEKTRTELKQWKKKSKKLLYSLLPARIALQIERYTLKYIK